MIRSRLRRTFATSVVLLLLILLLIFEEDAIRAARSALSGVMLHLIPALFPYMVLSSLLAGRIGRRIPPVLTRFFGLPGCGVTAILFGLLCGFPTGAALAVDGFRDGKLTN